MHTALRPSLFQLPLVKDKRPDTGKNQTKKLNKRSSVELEKIVLSMIGSRSCKRIEVYYVRRLFGSVFYEIETGLFLVGSDGISE